jgi:hypothetical protein
MRAKTADRGNIVLILPERGTEVRCRPSLQLPVGAEPLLGNSAFVRI